VAKKEPEKKEAAPQPVASKNVAGPGTSVNRKKAETPPSKPGVATPSVPDILSAMKQGVAPPPAAPVHDDADDASSTRMHVTSAGVGSGPATPPEFPGADKPRPVSDNSVLKLPTATGKKDQAGDAPPSLDELMQKVE